MKHVILDTDIFGDPDDLFALLYGLSLPQVHIELIVTADEHGESRAIQTRKLLSLLHKQIPVMAGTDLGNQRLLLVDTLKPLAEKKDFVTAISHVIQKYNQVTYLCIAPQSNLAAFLRHSPQLASKLELVIMGATIHKNTGRVEHNIRTDIGAAQFVASHTQARWILGDVTEDPAVGFSQAHRMYKTISRFSSPAAQMVCRNIDRFFVELYPQSSFHDPLALSAIVAPYVSFTRKNILILNTGQMITTDEGKSHLLSVAVDYKQFMIDFENQILTFLRFFEK